MADKSIDIDFDGEGLTPRGPFVVRTNRLQLKRVDHRWRTIWSCFSTFAWSGSGIHPGLSGVGFRADPITRRLAARQLA
jgi:hypothetical protein